MRKKKYNLVLITLILILISPSLFSAEPQKTEVLDVKYKEKIVVASFIPNIFKGDIVSIYDKNHNFITYMEVKNVFPDRIELGFSTDERFESSIIGFFKVEPGYLVEKLVKGNDSVAMQMKEIENQFSPSEEINRLIGRINNIKTQFKYLQELYRKLLTDMDTLKKENSSLKEALKAKDKKINNLLKTNDKILEENKILKKRLSELKKEMELLKSGLDKKILKERIRKAKNNLEKLKELIQEKIDE